MDRRHSYDLERRQELHNEIDKLELPEDRSNSDISAEYTPKREPSPVQGSPLDESERGSFSQQQVHKMMDWSQTHITPIEGGRFPQVSAPTMDMDSEANDFQLEEAKEERVAQMPRQPRSKDTLTFSPQQSQPWFFTPGRRRPSKHSFSGNSSEVLGSALLGPNQSHQGDSAYKTALDNSVMQDEVYKLKTTNTQLRAELKAEQEAHYQSERARQIAETENADLHDKVEQIQDSLELLQARDTPTLETLRGRQLELSRAELARVKTALAELNTAHVDLQHALSQKLAESPGTKDKELEGLSLELAKLKIVNTAAARKERELLERLEAAATQTRALSQQLQTLQVTHSQDLQTLQARLTQRTEQCEQLQEDLLACQATLRDCQGGCNAEAESRTRDQQEIESLRLTVDILQEENSAFRQGQPPRVDYQVQLAKLKASYEAQIAKLKTAKKDDQWLKKTEEWRLLERTLRGQLEQSKAETEELERQFREELESRAAAFEEENSKAMSLAQANRRLQSELQTGNETCVRLTRELQEAKEACLQAQSAAETLRQTLEPKRRRPSLEGLKVQELQTQLAEMQQCQVREESERARLELQLQKMRAKKDALKAQLQTAHEENEALSDDLRLRDRKKEMTLSMEYEAKLSELAPASQCSVGLQASLDAPLSAEVKGKLKQAEEALATAQALRQEKNALSAKLQQLMEARPFQTVGTCTEAPEEVSFEVRAPVQAEADLGDFAPETLRSELEAAEQLKQDLLTHEEELQEALESAQHGQHLLEDQVRELQLKLSKSAQEVARLKQLVESEKTQRSEAEEELETLQRDYEERLAALQTQTESFKQSQDSEEKQRFTQAELKLKTLYEQKLQTKTKELEDARSQQAAAEQMLAEVREEASNKQEKAKQELTRQRREQERELRTLQEEIKHTAEKTRQELELDFLTRLNTERKEADRKLRSKTKVLQDKHLQDLASQEALLKVQVDKQLADQAKLLGDQHRAAFRQKEAEFTAETSRLREEHEEALRQLTYEKSQLLSEYERRLRRPSLEASELKASLRASKSGFQDSVLTINDFRPDESEIVAWSQSNADRLTMVREDVRSFWQEERNRRTEQKLVEKAKIQKYVETQCRAAREAEQQAFAQAVAEELAGRTRSKLLGPLRERFVVDYESRLRELRAAQEAVVQKYRAKVAQLETALVQRAKKEPSPLPPDTDQEDSVFVRLGGHLYLSLKCAVEDLALVAECFEAAVAPAKKRQRVPEVEPSLERQKDAYRQLLNSLQRCAADVAWTLRSQPRERTVTAEAAAQCLLSEEQAAELARNYETRLRLCQDELHSATIERQRQASLCDLQQDWEEERTALESELRTTKAKLREWEESPALVPEMLSPSETCELVLSVFSRAHRQSFLETITLEHPEFFALLQDFLDAQ